LLPAGANRRVGLAPTGKRRLVTAHPHSRPSPRWLRTAQSGRVGMWRGGVRSEHPIKSDRAPHVVRREGDRADVIIFKAISPIIGAVIIPLYLSNFSIPISPAPDLSQQSQQIIGFELIALLAAGVGLFLLPFFPTYFVHPETLNGLPNLFGMRDISPDTPRRVPLPDRGTFFNFLSDYMPFYFTFLFLNLVVIPIDLYFEISIHKIMPWTLTLSFVISTIGLYIFKLKGRGLKFSTYIGSLLTLCGLTIQQ
jgi:hypothetical protein